MITYEFTAGQDSPKIFKLKPGEKTIDYLEVPLRLLIPRSEAQTIGFDRLQDGIEEGIKQVVRELNEEIPEVST